MFKKIIKKGNKGLALKKGYFGIEKESLRVNPDGTLALTPHPEVFGDKTNNPYIKVDFSESQLELVTPIANSVKEAYDFLCNIHEVVASNLDGEYIWSQSSPPILPSEAEIPIAKFPNNRAMEVYRENLSEKYGRKKQLLSGIHFNFSFQEDFLQDLYQNASYDGSYKAFKDEVYLKISRNYIKYSWMLIYLLGASPLVHKSYAKVCLDQMKKYTKDSLCFEDALSFRNSSCGYKNLDEFYFSYTSVDAYIQTFEKAIKNGVFSNSKEDYSSIRLKSKNPKDNIKALKNDGINYLEFRSIDLNPMAAIGVDENDLEFLHLFILFLFVYEEKPMPEGDVKISMKNQEITANRGNAEDFKFFCCKDIEVSAHEYSLNILKRIKEELMAVGAFTEKDERVLNYQIEKLNKGKRYAELILKGTKEQGFIDFHLNLFKNSLNNLQQKIYTFKGYEDLELSTQILLKSAIKKGVDFEILDRVENFIALKKDKKIQYVKQATKTSLDSYVSMLIMENKVVSKKVLEKANISVPKGQNYQFISDALNDYEKHQTNKGLVVKPKSTNFGIGITIFKEAFSYEEYEAALKMAFKEDSAVLIEEFVKGMEYRIFVLGDEVVGILHRVPANVKGNGESDIAALVAQKNKDPLRGKGYKTPLEQINLGEAEKYFLKSQGLKPSDVPEKKQLVYLRENSNISTGGDSIDFTDAILAPYKKIAVAAAHAAGAKICGVDMVIQDIQNPNPDGNYSIIEINFNPAIHIHCYPYQGKNRKLGDKILSALGYP